MLFSWLKRIFFPPSQGVPWQVRDGKRLRWGASDCPVNLYVDGSLLEPDASPWAIVMAEVRKLRAAGVRVLLLPVVPTGDTLAIFETSRATVQRAILIRAIRIHPGALQSFKCGTDLRWDKRTGFLRSAVVDWFITGQEETDAANLVHQMLGHCLGLAHQEGTVMAERNTGRGPGWLSAEQLGELLRVYGGAA